MTARPLNTPLDPDPKECYSTLMRHLSFALVSALAVACGGSPFTLSADAVDPRDDAGNISSDVVSESDAGEANAREADAGPSPDAGPLSDDAPQTMPDVHTGQDAGGIGDKSDGQTGMEDAGMPQPAPGTSTPDTGTSPPPGDAGTLSEAAPCDDGSGQQCNPSDPKTVYICSNSTWYVYVTCEGAQICIDNPPGGASCQCPQGTIPCGGTYDTPPSCISASVCP
jgi:hypothetical protein